MMTRYIVILLAGVVFLGAGCTPTIANRGNMLSDEQMEQVVVGLHTRSDVLNRLGSPTTVAPFNDRIWYYIGQETAKKGILDPEVVAERIVAVEFDGQGTVVDVADLDAERINLPVERDKTDTHGHNMTFLQQLLGNVGRFNPASQPGL